MLRIEGADISIQDFLHEHHENTSSGLQQVLQDSNILLNGVTSFLGSIILEKILRSCLGVSKVFVLVRSKDGKTPAFRFKDICGSRLFERLRMENPSTLTKISVISYNPLQTGLGLKQTDLENIKSSVNIIINAGIVRQPKTTFRDAVYVNINVTRVLLMLAKQMPRLEAFVHVSSVLCHHEEKMVDERFYSPPITGRALLSIVEHLSEDILENIAPNLLCEFPTASALTQAVAEDTIRIESKGLPLALVRVPFLVSSYKDPLAGWSHSSGPTGIAAQAMLGYLRILHCDPNCLAELVPVDIAANLIISVAADTVRSRQEWTNEETERHTESLFTNFSIPDSDIPIYNMVSSTQRQITWEDYFKSSLEQAAKVPFSSMVWHVNLFLTRNRYIYVFLAFLLHTLPAFIVGTIISLMGRQTKLYKKYEELNLMCDNLSFYTVRQQRYRDNNTRTLWRSMSAADQNAFNFNLYVMDWDEYFYTQCRGIRVYMLGDSLESVPSSKLARNRMKAQSVGVDLWMMAITSLSYLALAFTVWIFLRLVNACFWFPKFLNTYKHTSEPDVHTSEPDVQTATTSDRFKTD